MSWMEEKIANWKKEMSQIGKNQIDEEETEEGPKHDNIAWKR